MSPTSFFFYPLTDSFGTKGNCSRKKNMSELAFLSYRNEINTKLKISPRKYSRHLRIFESSSTYVDNF